MLLSLLFAATAHADDADLRTLLSQAKGALLAGEYKDARDLLTQAEETAPSEDGRVLTQDLARLFFYRGVLFWRASPESAALDAWRQTLTIDPDFQPEADLLGDASERDVFLALGGEVRARGEIDLALPEDPGEAVIYVDGRDANDLGVVIPGLHYVQIKCEDGDWAGAWHAYGAPPRNYLVLCDGGAYKAGGSKSSASAGKSSASKSDGGKASASKSGSKAGSAKAEGKGGASAMDIAGGALIALGAGGGAATAYLYLQAADSAEIYQKKLDAPEADADATQAYYEDVVWPRYTRTYAAGAASAVFLVGGVVLVAVGADGPMVTPLPGGGVLTWSGRF